TCLFARRADLGSQGNLDVRQRSPPRSRLGRHAREENVTIGICARQIRNGGSSHGRTWRQPGRRHDANGCAGEQHVRIEYAAQYANRAGSSAASDGSGCAGPSVRGADFVADPELPRLPLSIETLCPEKHVGEAGNSERGFGPASTYGAWPSG